MAAGAVSCPHVLSVLLLLLLQSKPVCIVLNKQDLLQPGGVHQQQQPVLSAEVLQLLQLPEQSIGLHRMEQQVQSPGQQHAVTVLQTSALTGAGIQSVLQWVVSEACC
jgi:hypothetical protein